MLLWDLQCGLLLFVLQHAIHSPRNLTSLLGRTVCVIFQPPSPFLRKVDLPPDGLWSPSAEILSDINIAFSVEGGCMTCNTWRKLSFLWSWKRLEPVAIACYMYTFPLDARGARLSYTCIYRHAWRSRCMCIQLMCLICKAWVHWCLMYELLRTYPNPWLLDLRK